MRSRHASRAAATSPLAVDELRGCAAKVHDMIHVKMMIMYEVWINGDAEWLTWHVEIGEVILIHTMLR